MDGLQIVILALVQGLTEFLPISSSAHLILAPKVFGFSDQGLAFDVAVHLGSLLAVVTYFRHEVIAMTAGMAIGLTREAASRFSFLLSIPTILMSGFLVTVELILNPVAMDWPAMLAGAICSFVAAYLCIHLFLRLIENLSMLPFVFYRMLLGGVLILFAAGQVQVGTGDKGKWVNAVIARSKATRRSRCL